MFFSHRLVGTKKGSPANLPFRDYQQAHQARLIFWSLGVLVHLVPEVFHLAKARVAIWDRIIQSSQQLVILGDFGEPLDLDLPHEPAGGAYAEYDV